ncbi:membrane protein [Alishewanella jeotgali]|uniref:Outer membrane protein, porin family n=1 Tax=Alishewanella jeotgali KCTC 22429 TaxID=1129374 RepID=H3ZC09_9ALTE|nr:membrane protein [Alishewanella jeotgali]EHR41854.1 outer membrane protein, porin family [Alishewanella jeotgali KCTC 22429]
MKKILSAVSAVLLTTSLSVTADPRWNYLGVGYTDAAGDGPYVEGSVKIAPALVLKADYSRQSVGRFDFNVIDVGVRYLTGFKLDFSPQSQTYLLAGLDSYSGDADETGVYFGAGVKHALSPQAQLFTEASYHTIADNYGSLAGGIAFYVSPDWALRSSLALNSGNAKNEFRFGVSYQF